MVSTLGATEQALYCMVPLCFCKRIIAISAHPNLENNRCCCLLMRKKDLSLKEYKSSRKWGGFLTILYTMTRHYSSKLLAILTQKMAMKATQQVCSRQYLTVMMIFWMRLSSNLKRVPKKRKSCFYTHGSRCHSTISRKRLLQNRESA